MSLSTTARELQLYVDNTEAFIRPAWETLGKFYKKGTFNLDRGIAYVERYVMVPAARQYNLENGSMSTPWHKVFPKSVRHEAAEYIVRAMVVEFRLGNFW